MSEMNKFNKSKMHYYIKGLQEPPQYVYSKEEIKQLENFVKNKYGEYTSVYHELYSPDIHLDILVVPPSKKDNYYKLITKGMEAYQMNVPNALKDHDIDRAELVIYLPPDWDFNQKDNGWVISLLKVIARTPIFENGWIGYGQTFSQNVEGTIPYSPNTTFSNAILFDSNDYLKDKNELYMQSKGRINFFQVVPIYREEMIYAKLNGAENLSEILSKEFKQPIVNNFRKNCCEEEINKLLEEEMEMEI